MPNLPQAIIEEILCRLPVKSLLRLRSACKSWKSLMTSAHFINMHLNQRTSDDSNENNEFLLVSSEHHLYSLDLAKTTGNNVVEPVELDFLVENSMDGFYLEFLGSCNGLILVRYREKTLFLLNPSTKESKKLPDTPLIEERIICKRYGFGYGSSIDDYKVVGMFYLHSFHNQTTWCDSVVTVYTLATNSWRAIGESPYNFSQGEHSAGTLLNGVIHWLNCQGKGLDLAPLIASFDLSDETFRDVPLPSSIEDVYTYMLGVLGGCLCMIRKANDFSHDIWLMREYGVRESWTNFRITHLHSCPMGPKPLCFLRNGIVLSAEQRIVTNDSKEEFLSGIEKLIIYDSEEETKVDLVVRGVPFMLKVIAYVETLVSPNHGNAIEGQP